jgi:hypothetical protein
MRVSKIIIPLDQQLLILIFLSTLLLRKITFLYKGKFHSSQSGWISGPRGTASYTSPVHLAMFFATTSAESSSMIKSPRTFRTDISTQRSVDLTRSRVLINQKVNAQLARCEKLIQVFLWHGVAVNIPKETSSGTLGQGENTPVSTIWPGLRMLSRMWMPATLDFWCRGALRLTNDKPNWRLIQASFSNWLSYEI